MKEDMVSHPKHYEGYTGKVECIEFTRLMPFSLGNAFKYIWRAGKKGGPAKEIEDLEKALWYLNDHQKHGCGWEIYNQLTGRICPLFSVIMDSIDDGGSNKPESWRRIALWHITEGHFQMAKDELMCRIKAILPERIEK